MLKISSHLIGLGYHGFDNRNVFKGGRRHTIWLVIILLISGITGFARLRLRPHTPAQVYVGYFTGSVVAAACLQHCYSKYKYDTGYLIQDIG